MGVSRKQECDCEIGTGGSGKQSSTPKSIRYIYIPFEMDKRPKKGEIQRLLGILQADVAETWNERDMAILREVFASSFLNKLACDNSLGVQKFSTDVKSRTVSKLAFGVS